MCTPIASEHRPGDESMRHWFARSAITAMAGAST
jgi:hypothetical protein